MLLGRFVALATRTATGKRLLWRTWYQFLAARYRDPSWTFMNYGYRSPTGGETRPQPVLDAADEPDRACIQLYDLVAGAVPLAGCDVLEVGCGRGGGAAYVARYLKPRRMVAIDLSPRAVALCRARFALPALSFEVGDAERLPFGDASFDAVLNVESSHCYGHLAAFLGEVRRVLRPGGTQARPDRERVRSSPGRRLLRVRRPARERALRPVPPRHVPVPRVRARAGGRRLTV